MITYHSVTLKAQESRQGLTELLGVLSTKSDTRLIFTYPNADPAYDAIMTETKAFVRDHDHAVGFASLGSVKYLSCLAQVDALVGNSSSGLLEMPYFKKATVNIGSRQAGRLRAQSVIDCEPNRARISQAIDQVYTLEFAQKLRSTQALYDGGDSVAKIMDVLKQTQYQELNHKAFFDLPPYMGHNIA